jgi:hypothetical protein
MSRRAEMAALARMSIPGKAAILALAAEINTKDEATRIAERKEQDRLRMTTAARHYAAADRTDPFAYRRAVAHIANGVASISRPRSERDSGYDLDSGPAFYSAEPQREMRKGIGYGGEEIEYAVTTYKNVVKP